MAASTQTITSAGRKKYEEELYSREHEIRDEINKRLQEAREFGDLSENAEYDAAREQQAENESRIAELIQILATAEVVEMTAVDEHDLAAAVGTEVELVDANGKHITFALVGTTETDSLLNRISNESPLGAALIGHVAGDTVSYETPTGKTREFTIRNITR
jgi:transcription elongation factor GreA